MTVPVELEVARRLAEAFMRSTCTITRSGGAPVWNEATGTYTDPAPVTVYSGACKLQDNSRAPGDAEAGDMVAAVVSLELHLPVDAEGSGSVRRGDVAKIDTNPPDAALVGREFVVQAQHSATAKTARRLPVEAVN